jgi:hypothetical protein
MTDNDAISRALEAHPTPWTVREGYGVANLCDAENKVIWTGARSPRYVLFDLVAEAVNAYAANRERDEKVKALVEALQDTMAQLMSLDQWGCDARQPNGGRLAKARAALAPFTQEPTP